MRLRVAIFAAVLVASVGSAHAEQARLVILHTTDLHGSLTAFDDLLDRPAPRGLVKIASLVDTARAGGAPVLLLDAGDTIEGAGIETVHQLGGSDRPDPMMAAMSRMGYDAMAIGNHEFDFGRAAMDRARQAAKFPWLAANILGPDGRPAFQPSLVKTIGGVRVGVVGLTTPATASMTDPENLGGLRFVSPVEAARTEVNRLRSQEHCDVIVLLAHTGLERDTSRAGAETATEKAGERGSFDEHWGYRLLTQVPGADVLILGHSHTVIGRLERGSVIAAQAGRSGEQLGRIDLTLERASADRPWSIVRRQSRMIQVTASTPDDAGIATLAEPYRRDTDRALDEVIGTASGPIDAAAGRLADGSLWELIQRAQLDASHADVSLATLFDPDAGLSPGPITRRQILRLYPYDNTLDLVKLTGRELRDVLEYSARRLAPFPSESSESGSSGFAPGASGYDFDAADGVTYEIDLRRPAGDRLVRLERAGREVSDQDSLTVAVNSYRANGAGGYPAIARAPRIRVSDRPLHEIIAAYVKRQGTLDGRFTPNWRLLPDYVASPERPLLERFVQSGALSREDLVDLRSGDPATRGEVAYWLARSFGWRERRSSSSVAGVPDSLQPWVDGLVRHKVLGPEGTRDRIRVSDPIVLSTALDWCERAARSAGYDVSASRDAGFRQGLTHRVKGLSAGGGDTLTRAQALGILANLRYPEVRILETTDFHGAILGGARDRATGRSLGGSAVLAAHIERLRRENPAGTVLIDGGDCFQGTMISNLQFGRPVVEQMNALHYAATVIGNHEFDWSADTLVKRVRAMRFSALGANMVSRATGKRPNWVDADTVVTRRGVRVGVLGLCYRFTPSVTLSKYVAHLRFEDDSTTAARLVPGLAQRSDVIVGVGHIPAESDSTRAARGGDLVRLAKVPGVAAWFGGHSHNLVDDRVGGVPVMIAGSHGEAIAVCDLVVDPVSNRVIESHERLVSTFADEVSPDSAMAARVTRWNESVGPIASRRIATNLHTLRRNRGGESTLGNLVTDAMRVAVSADIAMQNSGGLRADLPEGDVTAGSIYEVMPFDNTIFTLGLTGAQVRQAIEQGLRSGRVTQVSGIRYSFDLDRPLMSRVIALTDSGGAPLDTNQVYRVAVNDFMATGGDEYDVLSSSGRDRKNTGIAVRDVLETFVVDRGAKGPLDYVNDGRIQRVGRRPERASD